MGHTDFVTMKTKQQTGIWGRMGTDTYAVFQNSSWKRSPFPMLVFQETVNILNSN